MGAVKTETILILLVGAYLLTRPAAAPVEDSGSGGFNFPWGPPSAGDINEFLDGWGWGGGSGSGNGNNGNGNNGNGGEGT
jgi:hypothetical protein